MPLPDGAPAGDAGGAPRRWRLAILPSPAGPHKWKMQVTQVDAAEAVFRINKQIGPGLERRTAGQRLTAPTRSGPCVSVQRTGQGLRGVGGRPGDRACA